MTSHDALIHVLFKADSTVFHFFQGTTIHMELGVLVQPTTKTPSLLLGARQGRGTSEKSISKINTFTLLSTYLFADNNFFHTSQLWHRERRHLDLLNQLDRDMFRRELFWSEYHHSGREWQPLPLITKKVSLENAVTEYGFCGKSALYQFIPLHLSVSLMFRCRPNPSFQ